MAHKPVIVNHTEVSAVMRPKSRHEILPPSLPPRGLSRAEAAAYIGVSPTMFDIMVKDGRMPVAKKIGARTVWDRLCLDRAFAELPDASVAGRVDETVDSEGRWNDCAV